MGFLAFLLLQLSEAARGVREQKTQTERQKPFQNSRFTGKKKKKTRIYYSKTKTTYSYDLFSRFFTI